jgi:endoglucanase
MASLSKVKCCTLISLALCGAIPAGCQSVESNAPTPMSNPHPITDPSYRQGVNISHYLSQAGHHGFARPGYITEADMAWIAQQGYDHIRLPVDGPELLRKDGTIRTNRLPKVDEAIGWAHRNGLSVLLDMHKLPGSTFSGEIDSRLFTDEALQVQAIQLWRTLAERYRNIGPELRFEILNEPVAESDANVTAFYARVLAAIREYSSDRVVYVCSNRWGRIETVPALEPLLEDPNVAVDIHYYDPHLFTHQKASWVGAHAPGSPPVPFPGIVPDLAPYLPAKHYAVRRAGDELTVDEIVEDFKKLKALEKRYGVEIYIGEFGVYKKARPEDSTRWYHAVLEQCQENGFGWAVWDYKGGFAIRDAKTGEPTFVHEVLSEYLQ